MYDLSGNIWEWCWDWYDENYYKKSPIHNPTGAESSWAKVIRGGSWGFHHERGYVHFSTGQNLYFRTKYMGFRVVRGR